MGVGMLMTLRCMRRVVFVDAQWHREVFAFVQCGKQRREGLMQQLRTFTRG